MSTKKLSNLPILY